MGSALRTRHFPSLGGKGEEEALPWLHVVFDDSKAAWPGWRDEAARLTLDLRVDSGSSREHHQVGRQTDSRRASGIGEKLAMADWAAQAKTRLFHLPGATAGLRGAKAGTLDASGG